MMFEKYPVNQQLMLNKQILVSNNNDFFIKSKKSRIFTNLGMSTENKINIFNAVLVLTIV